MQSEKKEPVAPEQGIQVGDTVLYTDADHAGGKYNPCEPRMAQVVAVSKETGKPALQVTRLSAVPPHHGVPREAAQTTVHRPDGTPVPLILMVAIIVDADFSPSPAGTKASIGCWSWRRDPSGSILR